MSILFEEPFTSRYHLVLAITLSGSGIRATCHPPMPAGTSSLLTSIGNGKKDDTNMIITVCYLGTNILPVIDYWDSLLVSQWATTTDKIYKMTAWLRLTFGTYKRIGYEGRALPAAAPVDGALLQKLPRLADEVPRHQRRSSWSRFGAWFCRKGVRE
jgi:hypothetical protein